MGTLRLVLDARDRGVPAEVDVDRLGELPADRENRLWLDISDPGPAEVAFSGWLGRRLSWPTSLP
jgi:hypothetical protein